jgi:polysaccharide pyruvyl transferase WcaK-like protein
MIQKNVFIIADIGLGQNRSFHVGDEAMFISNVQRYKKFGYNISASSRSISHSSKDFTECLDVYIKSSVMFLRLVSCAFVLKSTNINLFPKFFKITVYALINSQLLHISGGGNIVSLWPGHIYYRCLMIIIARLYKIPVILTSQTIGPITNRFHKFILSWVLNLVKFIGVRDKSESILQLEKLEISFPEIIYMPDDATYLDSSASESLLPLVKNPHVKIGLSLHHWLPDDNDKMSELMTGISRDFPDAHFYLIPHGFDDKNGIDVKFMLDVTNNIPKDRVHKFLFEDLYKKEDILKTSILIKNITSGMDILLTTRYHGLIFALSTNIPVIALNYDHYCQIKNKGALNLYLKNMDEYYLDYHDFSSKNLTPLISRIFLNKARIERDLKDKINSMGYYKFDFYSDLINKYIL